MRRSPSPRLFESPGAFDITLTGDFWPFLEELPHPIDQSGSKISKFQTTIGRRNADATLDDLDVSRQHAVIERYEDRLLLKDLGSSNGTYLNGVRSQVACLEDGDIIRVGRTELAFRHRGDEPEK